MKETAGRKMVKVNIFPAVSEEVSPSFRNL
jgi:hypothetical protein